MASTTVTGRVRATVRLKNGDGGDAQVVAVSWASDRMFPRTRGVGVAFELETSDGVVLRVEPFEALVTLPVRQSVVRDGVRREDAWIASEDELTIEGELDAAGAAPTIDARRISLDGRDAMARMRLPPGALARGEAEEIARDTPPIDPAPSAALEPSAAPAGVEAAAEPAGDAPAPAVARRPKKKRPDSSGTPTPIQ
ncbi:MAG TPA: hypothetical protein VK989_00900 [Polyangia bacterium]|nr:hypothetical protein [Polyangia bacterium]